MRKTLPTAVTGAERLVEALECLGVDLAFGLPGVHNLPIWKALINSHIDLVGVRHEQTAVYAADGYARATGRLGVALVTTGPGAANTLGATGEAMASGSPALVIATDIPRSLRRESVYRGVLHETRDQAAMFVPVTKHSRTAASADEIASAVRDCGTVACTAPTGPVYLGVPTDLLAEAVGGDWDGTDSVLPDAPMVDPDELSRAIEVLSKAESPLIWAGGGALRAEAGSAIEQLALLLAAPVITTYMSRGLVAPDHPCAAPGPPHARDVGALWDEADVVLAIGTDFDGMMTQNWLMPAPSKLIAINIDPRDASKNYPADLTLVGDAREVTEQLLQRLHPRAAVDPVARRLGDVGDAVAASVEADEPQAARLLGILERVLPDNAVVVTDMCIAGYWLAGYRRVPFPRKLAYPVGWGTLGFGFPASIGAALADVGPTICVAGDGGFLFACGDLATVVEADVPVTIVLVDDGGYGMLRFDQLHAGDKPFGVDLVGPNFQLLAESFGLAATTVDGFGGEFEQALGEAVSARKPRMIVVNACLKPPPTTSPRWYRRQ